MLELLASHILGLLLFELLSDVSIFTESVSEGLGCKGGLGAVLVC